MKEYFAGAIGKLLIFSENTDRAITQTIMRFYSKGYFDQTTIPGLASKIPTMTKFVIYLFIVLILIIPLKIFFPESKLRSVATYAVFISLNILIFGMFFGFFQLLFSS